MAPSLEENASVAYGDWRDDFFKNGYVIIKGAVDAHKAQYYRGQAMDWVQSFNLGLDYNDKNTWTKEHLPQSFKSMYHNYCAAHERFMWEARTEPGMIEPFAKLWGTDQLLVSFDGFNVTLPGQQDDDYTPWPHVDQSPERKGLACAQGLLNLSPAGPNDGGLLLMEGSAALFEQFFKAHPPGTEGGVSERQYDFFAFKMEHLTWFEERGCKLVKVCVDPGDLIIWDSRTLHYVRLPESETIRTVIYATYTPAALAKEDDLRLKAEIFGRFEGTTHWPHCNIWGNGKGMVDGEVDPLERDEPLEKPDLTDQVLKLAGVKPYA